MRVILMDPSGDAYGAGLANGLSPLVDLYYVTSKNSLEKDGINCKIKYWYGRQRKNRTKIAKGLQYFYAFCRTLLLLLFSHVDVLHIEWLSIPKLDLFFLRLFGKTKTKLVFTAHNVLPHRSGEKSREIYGDIYPLFDNIIVHGVSIKNEFLSYYPACANKLSVQHHGVYFGHTLQVDNKAIDVIESCQGKRVLFFGNMFYNKGVDLLVRYWIDRLSDSDCMLLVVGKKDADYQELNALESDIGHQKNIYYYPFVLSEEELNYFIMSSDMVLMPYRHASMSGVVFKAAEFGKTILTTDTGSIVEYLDPHFCFIASTLDEFFLRLQDVLLNYSREDLSKMGKKLSDHIMSNYSWDAIAASTINTVYCGGFND